MRSLLLVWLAAALASCTATQMGGGGWADPGDASGSLVGARVDSESAATFEAAPADEARAAPPAEAQTPVPPPATPANDRQVIYSAALRLVVVSAREAFTSIQACAREAGGWLQESDARSITIRVPAGRFEDVVARIAALGEVVENTVRASDVTEEMLDLGIRLENARKARERLLEHLAHSDRIEDTLAIEQELARVTGEIEQMEGRQRFVQAQIAMSAIRVELNTSVAQRSGDGPGVPFDWIERLGDGLVAGTVQGMPRKPRFFARGPRFDPPADFVRYYSSKDLVEAMNADGVRLKLQQHDNYDEGALAFWRKLSRSSLVRARALAIGEDGDLGHDRAFLGGMREVGGEVYAYMLVLTRTKDDVYAFEAWGPKEAFERSALALVESAKSLRL